MITETTISIALLSNFITWYFVPFDNVREWIVEKWVRLCVKLNTLWAVKATSIITCAKCLAFWGGLVYTQNIIQAVLASMLAVFIKWMLEYVTKQ